MRVNIYAEEMTDRLQIIEKEIDGHKFTGLRFYLELPVSFKYIYPGSKNGVSPVPSDYDGNVEQLQGPFVHRPGDDDSSAVTFWGKRDLRTVLRDALAMLDRYYAGHTAKGEAPPDSTTGRAFEKMRQTSAAPTTEMEDTMRVMDAASKRIEDLIQNNNEKHARIIELTNQIVDLQVALGKERDNRNPAPPVADDGWTRWADCAPAFPPKGHSSLVVLKSTNAGISGKLWMLREDDLGSPPTIFDPDVMWKKA